MRVAFILDKQHSAHNLGAEWIFVLCREADVNVATVSNEIEVVDLSDPNFLKKPKVFRGMCESAVLYIYSFKEKSVGIIACGDWLSEQRFDSITLIKFDVLVILADRVVDDVDEIAGQLHRAVEKINIPIVFYDKNSGEYAVFGAGYEIEDGFFHFCI